MSGPDFDGAQVAADAHDMLLNGTLEITQAPEADPRELQLEAEAWGFPTWEAFCEEMDRVYDALDPEGRMA